MIHFYIVTLFPEAFESYFDSSILKRAQADKKIKISLYNPRDFTKDKHHRVDQKPYGGGPGMVLEAEPVLKAIERAEKTMKSRTKKIKVVFFSSSGKEFNTTYARKLSKNYTDIILIAGHYEGVDERVVKIARAEKVNIGPYVLTGGELPAMVVTDVVSRFVPGVLGKYESLEDERVSSSEVYTRPEVLEWGGKKYRVPKVLLSGDHKKIEGWRESR